MVGVYMVRPPRTVHSVHRSRHMARWQGPILLSIVAQRERLVGGYIPISAQRKRLRGIGGYSYFSST